MKIIDYLLEDRHRRYYMVFAAIMGFFLYELCWEIVFSFYLSSCEKTEDLLKLANMAAVSRCFIGRLITAYLQYGYSSASLLKVFVQCFSAGNVITLVLMLAAVIRTDDYSQNRTVKGLLAGIITLYLAKMLVLLYFVLRAITAGTTAIGISLVTLGANIFKYCSLAEVVIIITAMFLLGLRTYGRDAY